MSDVVSFGSSTHRLSTSEYWLSSDAKKHFKHHRILISALPVFIHEKARPFHLNVSACHHLFSQCWGILHALSARIQKTNDRHARDGERKKEDADASLAHVQQAAVLRSRLQSVRQLKQSLLIVDDVKVVHAGSHVRAVALHNFTSWENKDKRKAGTLIIKPTGFST